MARPRSFDEHQVLARCGEMFHRQGYDATSVDDLVAATGLKRGSLYQAFGSKRGVFLAVLRGALQSTPDSAARERIVSSPSKATAADTTTTKTEHAGKVPESDLLEQDSDNQSPSAPHPPSDAFCDDVLTLVAITCLELAPHDAKARDILADWRSQLSQSQRTRLTEALGRSLLKRAEIGSPSA
ncbi:helix-turn-helix domain containing protein [Bifidobacterium sp. ESL0763]|uniref:helix-turn-helix domain-containing protein n=1 Tax=Bifidobacterium sp. ESL0763 TaxID=2983227 RepID=UPI0023F908D4|nr:helix-turn-helix domain-containing protein [Bifidobacterium sp. ESL0763]MDF7663492.1 helix-turn-helix domain containing protein [Bifidobacterium sp. ESL0763]